MTGVDGGVVVKSVGVVAIFFYCFCIEVEKGNICN